MVQAVKDEMMGAATSTTNPKILELATGPGEPAASIARAFPNAQVVATDLSDDMILAARETCVAIPNMVAEKADMMDLGNYADDTFDVVTCCYGFMFPPDKDLALQETLRVLKPNGGVIITTVWNDLPTMRLIRGIMERVHGEGATPPPPPINPMSLSEPGLFEGMVEQAGFTDVRVSAHDYSFNFGSDPDLIFKQITMPVMTVLDEIDGAWDTAREVFEAEKLNYGEYDADDNYVIGNNVYKLLIAKK
jgi:SAM-dependent methyltransferase